MICKYLFALSLVMAFCKMFAGYAIDWDIIILVALFGTINQVVKLVLMVWNLNLIIKGYKQAKVEDQNNGV